MADDKEKLYNDADDMQTCEGCGQKFSEAKGEISYGPDPYIEDIDNRIEEKWLCKNCYHEYCMDI